MNQNQKPHDPVLEAFMEAARVRLQGNVPSVMETPVETTPMPVQRPMPVQQPADRTLPEQQAPGFFRRVSDNAMQGILRALKKHTPTLPDTSSPRQALGWLPPVSVPERPSPPAQFPGIIPPATPPRAIPGQQDLTSPSLPSPKVPPAQTLPPATPLSKERMDEVRRTVLRGLTGVKGARHIEGEVDVAKLGRWERFSLATAGALAAGMYDTTMSLFNVVRMLHGGAARFFSDILPGYDIENDPVVRWFDGTVNKMYEESARLHKPLKELEGVNQFLATGLTNVPMALTAYLMAFGMSPKTFQAAVPGAKKISAPLGPTQKLPIQRFAENYPKVARMVPFGTLAAGRSALHAEKEGGASFTQAAIAGVLTGGAEMVTEAIPFEFALRTIGSVGANALVETGARRLLAHHKKLGVNYLSALVAETAQEAAMSPIGASIGKAVYDREMPWVGEGGVVDAADVLHSGYGGLAMSVVLGALGLPAVASSHMRVSKAIREQEANTALLEEVAFLLNNDFRTLESTLDSPAIGEQIAAGNWKGLMDQMRHEAARAEEGRAVPPEDHIDGVTGLQNRRAFAVTKPVVDRDRKHAWVSVNLQNFDPYKQAWGDEAGNSKLQEVGMFLWEEYGENAFRIGSDRFAVVVPKAEALGVAENIKAAIVDEAIPETEHTFSVNVGHGATFAEADKMAETAPVPDIAPLPTAPPEQAQARPEDEVSPVLTPVEEIPADDLIPEQIAEQREDAIETLANRIEQLKKRNVNEVNKGLIALAGMGLDVSNARDALVEFTNITRKGMTPEEYVDAREEAWENIVSTIRDIDFNEEVSPRPEAEPVPAAPQAFIPLAEGETVTVFNEENKPIDIKYAVAEAKDLVTSHDTGMRVNPDFPAELQPRQRDRVVSAVQIANIAKTLNPVRLGSNPMITDGAPIVGPDGIVEIGNARTIAIKAAYEQNTAKAEEYRNWLSENAEQFGVARESIERAESPVLVRVRQTDVDRVSFTQEGNIATVAGMGAVEKAVQDAKKVTEGVLSLFVPNEEGRIDTAANYPFIRAFMAEVVPSVEHGIMMDARGRELSQDGIKRIRNAIFAKVYGNMAALEKLAEDVNVNVRNQVNAMVNAAPALLSIKENIRKGDYFPLDITEDVSAAMVKLSELRNTKMTVNDYLRQQRLFGEELSDTGKAILEIFDRHKGSARKLTAILKEYAHAVTLAGSPKQEQIFKTDPPTKHDVLERAVQKVEDEHEGQIAIFEAPPMGRERVETQRRTAAETAEAAEARQPEDLAFEHAAERRDIVNSVKLSRTKDGVMSRQKIIDALQKFFDVPIRLGRIQGKAALAKYKQREELIRVRLRNANNLRVLTHEIGHHLDKLLGLDKEAFSDELLSIPYVENLAAERPNYKKKRLLNEGVAEFLFMYLMRPETAQSITKGFYAYFEDLMVAQPEILDNLHTIREMIATYTGQTGLREHVDGFVGEEKKEPLSFQKVFDYVFDKMAPVARMLSSLMPAGQVLPADMDPVKKFQIAAGHAGRAHLYIQHGQYEFSADGKTHQKAGLALMDIAKPVQALGNEVFKDFTRWLIIKRAIEVEKHGKVSGLLDEEKGVTIDTLEEWAEEIEDSEHGELFKKQQKELLGYTQFLLKQLVKSGMLSVEAYNKIVSENQWYLPYQRIRADIVYAGQGPATRKAGIHRFKGADLPIKDPWKSLVIQTAVLTELAAWSDAMLTLVNLKDVFEGTGAHFSKVSPRMAPMTITIEELINALSGLAEKDGKQIDIDALLSDEGIEQLTATFFRPQMRDDPRRSIAAVWRKGKPEFYDFPDQRLLKAILKMDNEQMLFFGGLARAMANPVRVGHIANPRFPIWNIFRDQTMAMIQSPRGGLLGYSPIDGLRGLAEYIKQGDMFKEWLDGGGAMATFDTFDKDYFSKSIKALTSERWKNILRNAINPLTWFRYLVTLSQYSPNIGEYMALRREGKHWIEASSAGRDIVIDQGRHGAKTGILRDGIPFLNAPLQAHRRLFIAFRDRPALTIARCVMYITLPTLGLYLINRDNENYHELPAWRKDMFHNIPVGDPKRTKLFLPLPRPFLPGLLFGGLAERFFTWVDRRDRQNFDDFARTAWQQISPNTTFWPLELLYELSANRIFHTGAPIVPERETKLPAEEQYGPRTTETAKIIGRALNLSPRKIDFSIRKVTGLLGRAFIAPFDETLRATGIVEDLRPARGATEMPILEDFFTETRASGADTMTLFYQDLRDAEMAYHSERGPRNRREEELVAVLPYMRQISARLSELRRQERAVQKARTWADLVEFGTQHLPPNERITPEERKEILDFLMYEQLNMVRAIYGKPKIY